MCECYSNQYMVSSPSYNCYNCPSGCKYCNWNGATATCTACEDGSYLNSGACPTCMRVCATCSDGTTCDTPINNLVMNGNVAECSAGLFFENSTQTCKSCSTLDANCASCDYNPTPFDPANIAPVECVTPNSGYYILGGVATACEAYCDVCTNSTTCTTCSSSFSLDGVTNICYCDSTLPIPLYITNAAPYTC